MVVVPSLDVAEALTRLWCAAVPLGHSTGGVCGSLVLPLLSVFVAVCAASLLQAVARGAVFAPLDLVHCLGPDAGLVDCLGNVTTEQLTSNTEKTSTVWPLCEKQQMNKMRLTSCLGEKILLMCCELGC